MPQRVIYVSPRALGEAPRPPAVETWELARLFAGRPALAGVSLRIGGGRTVAIEGPNGAGKTTLLRLLATSLRPSFGRAFVDGIDLTASASEVRRRVGYLSHVGGLYDDLTAVENLRFSATLLGVGRNGSTDLAAALARVGLTNDADLRVRAFSVGMRRRLALARLLLARPSVLLLDEPYAGLDAGGAAMVDELLTEWRASGSSILVASHAVDRLTPLADGQIRLAGGVVAEVSGDGVESLSAPPRVPVAVVAGSAATGEVGP